MKRQQDLFSSFLQSKKQKIADVSGTNESNRISSRSKAAIRTVSAATTQQLAMAASPQAAPTMAAADSFLKYPDFR